MSADSPSGKSRTLVVDDVVHESPDAISIVFDVADTALFAYRPGQFLTLRVPSERTGSVARCYSLASSPHRDDRLRVIVKRTPDGYASNWLNDNLRAGAELEVLPPSGVFGPKDLDQDLVLFAGGSGITPMLSILKSALTEGNGHLALLYANRDEASVIAAAELRELVVESSGRLHVHHWLESLQGLPDAEAINRFAEQFSDRETFICGPAPFMDTVQRVLRERGQARSTIHVEVFSSLSSDPFTEYVPEPVGDETADGATVHAEVELDGEVHQLDWPRSTRLLDYMLSLDIDVPYMCRNGECGTCQATCTAGKVTLMHNDLLDEADLADGYVLTCQLLPAGDDPIRIEF